MPEDGSTLFVTGGLAVRPAPGTWAVTNAFAAVEARPATGEDFGDAAVGVLASRYLTWQVVVLDGGVALRGD